MAEYEKVFSKPYPNGWKNRPTKTTAVTAEIMDGYDAAIEALDNRTIEMAQETENIKHDLANDIAKAESNAKEYASGEMYNEAVARNTAIDGAVLNMERYTDATIQEAVSVINNEIELLEENKLSKSGGEMTGDAEVIFEKEWTATDSNGNVITYKQKTVISRDGVLNYYWDSDSDEYREVRIIKGVLEIEDYDGITSRFYAESIRVTDSLYFMMLNNRRYVFGTTYFGGDSGEQGADLGTNFCKWNQLYATNGTIQTSDRNEKSNVADMTADQAEALIYGLKPSTYQMNSGTSGRTHWGMISQDIEELLDSLGWTSLDFAGFIKSPKVEIEETVDEKGRVQRTEKVIEGEYTYSLRYDEFVAPLIKVVQEQKTKIDSLEERLAKLEAKLN